MTYNLQLKTYIFSYKPDRQDKRTKKFEHALVPALFLQGFLQIKLVI